MLLRRTPLHIQHGSWPSSSVSGQSGWLSFPLCPAPARLSPDGGWLPFVRTSPTQQELRHVNSGGVAGEGLENVVPSKFTVCWTGKHAFQFIFVYFGWSFEFG